MAWKCYRKRKAAQQKSRSRLPEELAIALMEAEEDLQDALQRKQEVYECVKDYLQDNDIKIAHFDGMRVYVRPAYCARYFDSSAFKKDHEDIYEEYRTSVRSYKESLVVDMSACDLETLIND